jgi:hypothetical protein
MPIGRTGGTVLAAIVVAMGAYYIHVSGTTSKRRAEVQGSDVASLENEVKALKQALAEVAARPDRRIEVPVRVEQPGPGVAQQAATPPMGKQPTTDELRDSVEAKFVSQSVDPTWSKAAQVQAGDGVTRALPLDSRLLSVECRTSMCRVETSHKDMTSYREFVQHTLMSPDFGWDGPKMATVTKTDSNGGLTTLEYLGRPGERLDEVE